MQRAEPNRHPGRVQPDHPLADDIRRYYDKGGEDARLRQGSGRLELWRTQDILRRWLPEAPATGGRFTTAYFHRPDELAEEMSEAGLSDVTILGVEGMAAFLGNAGDLVERPESRAVLLRWLRVMEAEPSLLGASPHLLGLAVA